MNQKGIANISIIGIIVLLLVAAGSGYFLLNRQKINNNNQIQENQSQVDNQNQIQNENQQSLDKEETFLNYKEMTEDEIKEYFHATEIIANYLPDSIRFWTEAECSYLNTKYSYKIPNNYYISSEYCSEKEIGTHGGCSSCTMTLIGLRKDKENVLESNFAGEPEIVPVVSKYCSQFSNYYYMSGFYVNVDLGKKGIFAMCSGYWDNFYFATLHNENGKWIPIMEGSVGCENNCQFIEKIKAKDFDNDGIDEIVYTYGVSGADAGNINYNLYSFQFKKWFFCLENWRGEDRDEIICGNYDQIGDFIKDNNSQWIYLTDKKVWIKN